MILIVESGATKTSWRAIRLDGGIAAIETEGLSPTCMDSEAMQAIIRRAIPALNPKGEQITDIHFYGAGLVSEVSNAPLSSVMQMWCPFAQINFHSDILASARALLGDGSGVAAIMGTGSNSCLYINGEVVRNIRPGGYILGDEGSGTSLGRMFLADLIKGMVPSHIEEEFNHEYGFDYSRIVQKVYKEAGASAFMASFAPFILKHQDDKHISQMIDDCLESFIKRVIVRYAEQPGQRIKVGVTGSFGCACKERLVMLGDKHNVEFEKFIKSPIDELVKYHM